MKVSKRGQYGMRALCHLAETHGSGVVQIREIARKEIDPREIPRRDPARAQARRNRPFAARHRRRLRVGPRTSRGHARPGDARPSTGRWPRWGAPPSSGTHEERSAPGGFYSVLIGVRDAAGGDPRDQTDTGRRGRAELETRRSQVMDLARSRRRCGRRNRRLVVLRSPPPRSDGVCHPGAPAFDGVASVVLTGSRRR